MHRQKSRHGLSLVEVVVALVVFTVGILGLQGATVAIVRQMRDAHIQSLATSIGSSRFERLYLTSCEPDLSGSETVRGIRSTWSAPSAPQAIARDVSQVVAYEASSGSRADEYQGSVRCR